jgi:membrane protease YdiL (CAAX protease family)
MADDFGGIAIARVGMGRGVHPLITNHASLPWLTSETHMNASAICTYGLLTFSVISLWIPIKAGSRNLIKPWMVILSLTVLTGMGAGYIRFTGLIAIILLGTACYAVNRKQENHRILRIVAGVLVILMSAGMLVHVLPGFSNPKIISGIYLSPDAIPYTKYLDFDKTVAGVFILAFGHNLIKEQKEWFRVFRLMVPVISITMPVVMIMSLGIGYVHFDMKFPSIFFVWAWTNLFFTCMAEEAFFRGFLQKHLVKKLSEYPYGRITGMAIVSSLFGLAHYAGGIQYIILATVAGFGYGWSYERTGYIEAAILTHFLLNTLHFLFFTYPVLVSAFV